MEFGVRAGTAPIPPLLSPPGGWMMRRQVLETFGFSLFLVGRHLVLGFHVVVVSFLSLQFVCHVGALILAGYLNQIHFSN